MLTRNQYLETQAKLKSAVKRNLESLAELRGEVRKLARPTRIQPRSIATVSLVGTDGGHNQTGINPFLTQLMRVVDSNDLEHTMEVVHAQDSLEEIWERHQDLRNGKKTPLRVLMDAIGITAPRDLHKLTPVLREQDPAKRSPSWLQVYRHITEWAVLFQLVSTDYGSDTLFVWDGPLRTKVFPSPTFSKIASLVQDALDRQLQQRNRRYYIAGITKHSKVLERYRLAMALEGVMRQAYPCFVPLTGDLIYSVIDWIEYLSPRERASISDIDTASTTKDVFSAGQMYFVKFGSRPRDPVWVADVWQSQCALDQQIFGYLLHDAIDGFPVPLYPQCLQKAHRNAALVDFDMDIFHHQFGKELRAALGDNADIVDELELQDADPAGRRYE